MGAWIRAVAMAAIDRRRVGTSKGMTPLPRLAPIVAILACVPRESAPPVLPSLSATRATPAPASVRNAAPDEDRDGVPDGVDLCAGEEEVRNAYRDDDGCPDEQPVPLLRAFSGGLGLVSFVPKPRPQRGSPVVEWLSVPTRIAGGVEIHAYVPPDAFVEAATARRATFAAPVETAAYPHLRRLVVRGELPPPGVLRIESMVDHFADEAPLVGEPLAIGSEVGPCPRSGRRGPRIGRTTATRRRTGACASTSCSEGSNSETRWSGLEVATLPAVDQQETHRAQAGVPAVAGRVSQV